MAREIVEELRKVAATRPGEQSLWDCTVAAWAADEIERLQNVILDFIDMVDGKGSPPLPVIISQMRLFLNQQK